MGAFRYAQTMNTGYLPNEELPNTFNAAGYDLGDPCTEMDQSGSKQGGTGPCCDNTQAGKAAWACFPGAQPYTTQYMGGLHPRVKGLVGKRLALAARAHVYGDAGRVWTGPVLQGCTISTSTDGQHPNVTLHFDKSLLLDDAVMVLDPTGQTIDLDDRQAGWGDNTPMDLRMLMGPSSPFEIEINGNRTHSGTWLSLAMSGKCQTGSNWEVHNGKTCSLTQNWTRSPDYADVVVPIATNPFSGAALVSPRGPTTTTTTTRTHTPRVGRAKPPHAWHRQPHPHLRAPRSPCSARIVHGRASPATLAGYPWALHALVCVP